MATPTPAPTPTSTGLHRPFDALDTEWTVLCRRHRRSAVIAEWAHQQPALTGVARLADAIPPVGVDRRPHCQALAALAASGDDLAARALLQLLVPGLVRLAGRWRWQLDGMDAAGWEVIARAGLHIGRLAHTRISGSVAGWLLRSVERDLVDDARRSDRSTDGLGPRRLQLRAGRVLDPPPRTLGRRRGVRRPARVERPRRRHPPR